MRGYDAPPNLPKDLLLATKWGFCRRDKGVRFKKVRLFGTPHHFSFGNPGVGALRCYGVHMNITRKTDH